MTMPGRLCKMFLLRFFFVIPNNALIIPHSDNVHNWFFFISRHYLTSSLCHFLSLQFYDLLERDGAAKSALEFRAVTVFAPTNQAFQRYPDLKINVLYHMSKFFDTD